MAPSDRVRRILSEVRDLPEEERGELVAELVAEDEAAARAYVGEPGVVFVGREELEALFGMSPAEARARLAAILDASDQASPTRSRLMAFAKPR